MNTHLIRVAAGLAAALALAGSPRAADQSLSRAIVGTWKLVSTEQRLTDGSTRPSPLYGPHGIGYLMYGDAGRMCAVLSAPDRVPWRSEDSPTNAELRSTFEHFVAYCGRYEVNEAERYVVHHVEMDVVPNSTGHDLKRLVSMNGNRLMLRPAEPLARGVVDYALTWERVDNSGVGPAQH